VRKEEAPHPEEGGNALRQQRRKDDSLASVPGKRIMIRITLAVVCVLCLLLSGSAYTRSFGVRSSSRSSNSVQHHQAILETRSRSSTRLFSSPAGAGGGLDDATRTFLDNAVKANKVLLFMKGNKLFPQCGFSNTAVRILDALGTPFETINVLDSDKIRNGVKVYSSWPTIPQLYVGGEFIGGTDIMIELYNNGQLAEMVELANAN